MNTDPLTEAELARVIELDAKATKGPFAVSDDDLIEVHREGVHVARFPTTESFPCLDPEYDDLNALAVELKANAELFAEYRTICPRLARELLATREKLKAARDVIFDGYRVYSALDDRAKTRTSAENVSDVLDALNRTQPAMNDHNPDEQAAFEKWMERTNPTGDHESVMRQWRSSSDFIDLNDQSARIAELERQLLIERGEVEAGKSILKDLDEEVAQLRATLAQVTQERDEARVQFERRGDMLQNLTAEKAELAQEYANEMQALRAQLAASEADRARIEAVVLNCWGVTPVDEPTGGDDSEVYWHITEYHMAKPHERIIGQGLTWRDAIDAAMQPPQ